MHLLQPVPLLSLCCIVLDVIYCILSKNLSSKMPRKLVAIRVGMNKMAVGDKYLDYPDETLERMLKPCNAFLEALLTEMAVYELTVCASI